MYFSIVKVMNFLLEKFPNMKNVHFYFQPKYCVTHEFGINIIPIAVTIQEDKTNERIEIRTISLRHEKLLEIFDEQPYISFKPNEKSRKINPDEPLQILSIKNNKLKFNEYEYYKSTISSVPSTALIEKIISCKIIPTVQEEKVPEINIDEF
jgi:hypothetical protein